MARPRSEPELIKAPEAMTPCYLLDVSNQYEEKLLESWLRKSIGPHVKTVPIRSSRRGKGGDLESLQDCLQSDPNNTLLIPARVVWMAPEKAGRRSVSLTDIFTAGDPRDPRGIRARWIRRLRPSRVRYVTAEGATSANLASDYLEADQVDPLTSFVTRRAWRALDRVERRLQGNRYKIPRFVPQEILSRREFLTAVDSVADDSQTSRDTARSKAEKYLNEIAATHSPYVIDLIANGIRRLYRQGYGEIKYSMDDVARIASLGEEFPIAFLPAHRSNLDRLSLQYMLWENDLPPNHTAGGINMNFFPVGPLIRRTGVFFIRRSFKDNPLYKTVLRSYLDFLVEKRFPLEWYPEGGRSRSGKLMPPRFGLLNYVVDSQRRGKAEDIRLIPVSIVYDQIQDVADYTREAQGKAKEKESIGWLLKAVRSLRKRYGDIHISFGQPVSVAGVTGSIEADEETPLGLQKLAFEVMHRIAQATPVTPTALVSVALLAARGVARTPTEVSADCVQLVDFLEARSVSFTDRIDLGNASNVEAILDWLTENGNVSSHTALGRRVFWLTEEQMIRVSYYRNMIVHFFIPRALAEMAITAAAESGHVDPAQTEAAMLGFRDLLKFEFFFPEKDEFLAEASADIGLSVPNWKDRFTENGPSFVRDGMNPVAYWSVLPFLDAYQVVGDELEDLQDAFDEKRFLKACLARARMYRIEERLISGESASQVLFKSALALAKNRDLLEESSDVGRRRAEFAAEVRQARQLAAAAL